MRIKKFSIKEKVDNNNIFFVRLDGDSKLSNKTFKAYQVYPKILVIPERLYEEDKIDPKSLPSNKKKSQGVYDKEYLLYEHQQQEYLDNIHLILSKIEVSSMGKALLKRLSISSALGQNHVVDYNNSVNIMANQKSDKSIGRGIVSLIIAGPNFDINAHSTTGYSWPFSTDIPRYNLQTSLFGSYAIIRYTPDCMPIIHIKPDNKFITFDPFVALFHEMVHALHYNYGFRLQEIMADKSPYLEHLVIDGKYPDNSTLKLEEVVAGISDKELKELILKNPEPSQKLSEQIEDISNDMIKRKNKLQLEEYENIAMNLSIKYHLDTKFIPREGAENYVYNIIFDNFSELGFAEEIKQPNTRKSYEDMVVGHTKINMKDPSVISSRYGFIKDKCTNIKNLEELPFHPSTYNPGIAPYTQPSRTKIRLLKSLNFLLPVSNKIKWTYNQLKNQNNYFDNLSPGSPINIIQHGWDSIKYKSNSSLNLSVSESMESINISSVENTRELQLLAHEADINFSRIVNIKPIESLNRKIISDPNTSFSYIKNFKYKNNQASDIFNTIMWAITMVEDFHDNVNYKQLVNDATFIIPLVGNIIDIGFALDDHDYKRISTNVVILATLWYAPALAIPALAASFTLREKSRHNQQKKIQENINSYISEILLRIKSIYKIKNNDLHLWHESINLQFVDNARHIISLIEHNKMALINNIRVEFKKHHIYSNFIHIFESIAISKLDTTIFVFLENIYANFNNLFFLTFFNKTNELKEFDLESAIYHHLDYLFSEKIPYLVPSYKKDMKEKIHLFFKDNKDISKIVASKIFELRSFLEKQKTLLYNIQNQKPLIHISCHSSLQAIENGAYYTYNNPTNKYKYGIHSGKAIIISKSKTLHIKIDKEKCPPVPKIFNEAYSISFEIFIKKTNKDNDIIFINMNHNIMIGYENTDNGVYLTLSSLNNTYKFYLCSILVGIWQNVVFRYNDGKYSILIDNIYRISNHKAPSFFNEEFIFNDMSISFCNQYDVSYFINNIRIYNYPTSLQRISKDYSENRNKIMVYNSQGNLIRYNHRYILCTGMPNTQYFFVHNRKLLLVNNSLNGEYINETLPVKLYCTIDPLPNGSSPTKAAQIIDGANRDPSPYNVYIKKINNITANTFLQDNSFILFTTKYNDSKKILGVLKYIGEGRFLLEKNIKPKDFNITSEAQLTQLLMEPNLNKCIINVL